LKKENLGFEVQPLVSLASRQEFWLLHHCTSFLSLVSDRLFLLSHPKFWILILDFWGKEKVLIFGERGFLRRERNGRICCPWFCFCRGFD